MAVSDRERPGDLGNVFARFAEEASNGGCPLYTALAEGVSGDAHVLDIASSARQPPVPNLLFAAVHFLLLRGVAHALTSFYASLTPDPSPAGDAYHHFRDFCMEHESDLRGLLPTRLVQTNEVARCSYLRSAFAFIADETQGQPLSLVDVGASAGLNLLWDRYAYDYRGHGLAGDRNSPVRISVEVRGDNRPPIPHDSPSVAFRTGVDLNPVDVTDPDSALWLRALVWPGHERRADRLQAAMALALRTRQRSSRETPCTCYRRSRAAYRLARRSASSITTPSISSLRGTADSSAPWWTNAHRTGRCTCFRLKDDGDIVS